MTNPMDTLKLLMKRVAEEIDDLDVSLIRFNAVPSTRGPDIIAITIEVHPDALKSSGEIEVERLEEDFFSVLGDMSADVDEHGNVVIGGGGDADDPEAKADAEERERIKQERIERIRKSLKPKDDNDS